MKIQKHNHRNYFGFIIGIFLLIAAVIQAQTGNIDPNNKSAWGTNIGWVDFRPANGGVTVYHDHLEGYAYAENIGWIRLGTHTGGSPNTYANTTKDNYGVNRHSSDYLYGYAWSTNAGWIDFNPTNGGVTIDPATGSFDGYAWGENIGWVHFKKTGIPAYNVAYENAPSVLAGIENTALEYSEGDAPVILTNTITITDADDANIESATVTITGNYQSGADELDFTNQNGITGSWNAANGALTLSGTATLENYKTALTTVTFENASSSVSTLTRTISFTANDGRDNSNTVTRDMTLREINNTPFVSVNTGGIVEEGGVYVFTDQNLKSIDPDGPSYSITFIVLEEPGFGALTFHGTRLLKGDSFSFTQNDIANGKLKYKHNGDESSNDSFTFKLSDDRGGESEDYIFEITINGTNDPPVITGIPILTINEDENYTISFSSLYGYVDDPDNADSTLTFTILNTCNNICVTEMDIGCGICGTENWFGETLLKMQVSDGTVTVDTTFTIAVLSVNDLPVINGLPTTLSITNGDIETIELNGQANDVETPNNLLTWSFSISPDSVNVSHDEAEGIVRCSAKGSFDGTAELTVTVTDEDGGTDETTITITVTPDPTGINELNGIPTEYELSQNYPNPFNPSTVIRYGIPRKSEWHSDQHVTLKIFDILGNLVATLQDGAQSPGYYERTWDASDVSSGVYLYVLKTGSYFESKKMIFLK